MSTTVSRPPARHSRRGRRRPFISAAPFDRRRGDRGESRRQMGPSWRPRKERPAPRRSERCCAPHRFCVTTAPRAIASAANCTPPRAGEHILVTRRPIGVVGAITPFNFPIAIPAWKIAPALVFGNAVVWKPANAVPLLAVRLAPGTDGRRTSAWCAQPGDRRSIGRRGDCEPPRHRRHHLHRVHCRGRRIAASAAARGVLVQAEMGGKTRPSSPMTPTSTSLSNR